MKKKDIDKEVKTKKGEEEGLKEIIGKLKTADTYLICVTNDKTGQTQTMTKISQQRMASVFRLLAEKFPMAWKVAVAVDKLKQNMPPEVLGLLSEFEEGKK
jgi:hypothetical protein